MTTEQAVDIIEQSDLPEAEQQRLCELVRSTGWTSAVRQEILAAIQASRKRAQQELDDAVAGRPKQETWHLE